MYLLWEKNRVRHDKSQPKGVSRSYPHMDEQVRPSSKARTYLFSSMSDTVAQLPHLDHHNRFIRRIECIRYILFLPQAAAREIKGDALANMVSTDQIETNTDLFYAVAQIEARHGGVSFTNDEANSLAKYLRTHMRKEFDLWPRQPSTWRDFLMHQWPHYLQEHGVPTSVEV